MLAEKSLVDIIHERASCEGPAVARVPSRGAQAHACPGERGL